MAGRQAGSLADEIWSRLEIFNACCRLKCFLLCLAKALHNFNNFDALQTLF